MEEQRRTEHPDERTERTDGTEREERPARVDERRDPREPVPGIRHEPEPDGENIIPAKDQPGTL